MKTLQHPGRRSFIRTAAALSTFGLASRFDTLGAIAAAHAQAAPAGDYKALVCVFMFGGNDGNNTVIPVDTAGYAQYAAARTAASGIQLAQSSLLPIQPVRGSRPYGLHPAMTEMQGLFEQKKLAVLANVGTLVQPITQAQYTAGVRPLSLYSHSDQQAQWQSAVSGAAAGTGWGGRVADKVQSLNASSGFPVVTSLNGTVLFTTGSATVPLAIPVSGSFALAGYSGNAAANARLAAVNALLAEEQSNVLARNANAIGAQALRLSATVNPILTGSGSTIAPIFANLTTNTAKQLLQVARMIEARGTTQARRQIFFVQLGSFDTHSNQLQRQDALLRELSPALKAFHDATVALGVSSQVTTFSLSDFGRTLQPASGGGTDHAWGNHHFILGGAVKGGDIYGEYPQLVLGGPNDAEREGRWIPTTAVDQYGATLARWFGVSTGDLSSVFPNLGKFATSDLGFMI